MRVSDKGGPFVSRKFLQGCPLTHNVDDHRGYLRSLRNGVHNEQGKGFAV